MINLLKNLFGNTSSNLKNVIDHGAIVIDVRTPAEFQNGHIAASRNIPLDKIKESISLIKSFHKPVILVCHSGIRSETAKQVLAGAGIETYNGGSWVTFEKMLA
jgi:phage shock protein E